MTTVVSAELRRVTCPHCGRTLFWSVFDWAACAPGEATVSVRCTRKSRCGVIVPLRTADDGRRTMDGA